MGGFFGSGGSLPDYLFVAIVMLGPVWLSTVIGEATYEKLPFELVRDGTTLRWFWRSIAPSLLWYPLYLSAVLSGSLFLLWLRFGSLPLSDSQLFVGPPELYYHLLVNGTLQGWCLLIVVRLARWVVGSAWGGLGALGALFALGAVTPRQGWLPLADLGFGQLLDGRGIGQLTVGLASWLLVLSVASVLLTTRFSTPFIERNLSQ